MLFIAFGILIQAQKQEDTILQLTPTKAYAYTEIKANQTIRFAFSVNPEKAE